MKTAFKVLLTMALFIPTIATANDTESDIKDILIQRSIDAYPGRCPCPYFTDKSGRRCGTRSAYSRPGGESPLCYHSDVTPAMVREYRQSKNK